MSEQRRNWGGAPPTPPTPFCRGAHVDATTPIVVDGVAHRGSVSHFCVMRESDHMECVCECGKKWMKNFHDARPA